MLATLLLSCAPLLALDDFSLAAARDAAHGQRAALALEQFRAHPELATDELNDLWSFVQAELDALRLRSTAPLVAALHERYAAPWTAVNLALLEQKLGRYDEVDRLLEAVIRTEREAGRATGGLVSQWGILVLGRGDGPRARALLVRADALGSDDASVVLARLDLTQDRPRSASERLRARMLAPAPDGWTQRVWGLALLSTDPAASDSETRDRP